MDKTTKFILGLIAVALIGINIQMWNPKLIKDAHAVDSHSHDKYEIYGLETMLSKSDVENIVEDCSVYVDGDYGSISC